MDLKSIVKASTLGNQKKKNNLSIKQTEKINNKKQKSMKLKTGNKKLNQTKSWLFEKNSNIDSFLANAIKKKKKNRNTNF